MGSYIANFTVYTMAMLGLIFFAIFVYKKFMDGGLGTKNSKFLNIEETMNINPRKSLLVVRAGNERFLIASDVDRTTLLSKLDENKHPVKDFDRFKNIVQEENIQIPDNFINQNRVIDMDIIQNQKNQIHLEPIKTKNPQASHLKRGMDRRENRNQNLQRKTNLKIDTNQNNQGLATIREMAKKINEL